MSSLSPSPDQRKSHHLRDKTNSPQKPQNKHHDPFNSSLIQVLPSLETQRDLRNANNSSTNEDRQTSNVIISKLMSQNEFLRKQIKELNSKLSEHVANLAKKAKTKHEPTPPSENILRKQLQNAYKQIEWYKKEAHAATENAEVFELVERTKKYEDLILEKDIKIDKLITDKKNLEKMLRDQEKEIETYRDSFGYEKRLTNYYEEVKCLRDKIANMNAVNRHNENNFRKQQEHLVDLTIQYRLVCDKVGVSPSTTFRTVEELNRLIKAHTKAAHAANESEHNVSVNTINTNISRAPQSHRDKSPNLPKGPASKNIRSQSVIKRGHIRVTKVSSAGVKITEESMHQNDRLQIDEERYKQEIQRLQMRVFMLENERRMLRQKLKEHEKMITIRNPSSEQSKRTIIQHRSLSRINILKQTDSQRNSVYGSIPSDDESNTTSKKLEFDQVSNEHRKTEALNKSINKSIREELNETRTSKFTHKASMKATPKVSPKTSPRILPQPSPKGEKKVTVTDSGRETFSNFAPLENEQPSKSTQEFHSNSNHSSPKKPLFVLRKIAIGRMESGSSEFNDKEYIPNPFVSKITQLKVWSDYEFVYGVQAFYSMQDMFDIAGEEHIKPEMLAKVKDVSSIEIEPDDQIAEISGKYSEGITYLQVKTMKGVVKEFGTDRDFGDQFVVSFGPKETLAMLHGAFCEMKGDEEHEIITILANMGFSVVKEQQP